MIELYGMGSPNVVKIYIALEELGLQYNVHPVDVFTGKQFDTNFRKLNPMAKVPVMRAPGNLTVLGTTSGSSDRISTLPSNTSLMSRPRMVGLVSSRPRLAQEQPPSAGSQARVLQDVATLRRSARRRSSRNPSLDTSTPDCIEGLSPVSFWCAG